MEYDLWLLIILATPTNEQWYGYYSPFLPFYQTNYHLISCIKTTFVLSPAHPLSPLATVMNRQVGSTTTISAPSFSISIMTWYSIAKRKDRNSHIAETVPPWWPETILKGGLDLFTFLNELVSSWSKYSFVFHNLILSWDALINQLLTLFSSSPSKL